MMRVFDHTTTIALAMMFLAAVASRGDEPHWAYQPIVRPALPWVENPESCAAPIDCFIAKRLEAEGVHTADEADRVTLIRRVSLDVIGLPPTPEEVREFVNDDRPGADCLPRHTTASMGRGLGWIFATMPTPTVT